MDDSHACTTQPKPPAFAALSTEIQKMLRALNRFLDVTASVTVVSLALYIAAATLSLNL